MKLFNTMSRRKEEFVTVRAATVALGVVTNRKFTKNMQQKKEKVS